jgi:hypothetical protein
VCLSAAGVFSALVPLKGAISARAVSRFSRLPCCDFVLEANQPASAQSADLQFSSRPETKKAAIKIAADILGHFLGHPVAELQVFPYFAPLMAVLEGFLGMMLGFAEGMFRIANCFAHCF